MPFSRALPPATVDKTKKSTFTSPSNFVKLQGAEAVAMTAVSKAGSQKAAIAAAKATGYSNVVVAAGAAMTAYVGSRITRYPTRSIPTSGIFVAQYGSDGRVNWMVRISGVAVGTGGYAIVSHSTGNLTVVGSAHAYVVPFDKDGVASSIRLGLVGQGGGEGVLIQYTGEGFPVWGARIAGNTNEAIKVGCTDKNDNITVSGQYSPLLTIYDKFENPFTTLSTGGGWSDVFVVQYGYNGMPKWAARIASNKDEGPAGICSDSNGNITLTGGYGLFDSGTTAVYGSDGNLYGSLPVTVGYNTFLIQYDSLGMVRWMSNIIRGNGAYPYGICTDINDNITLVSGCPNSSQIYDKTDTLFGTTRSNSQNIIMQYTSEGFVNWRATLTNGGLYCVCADSQGNITAGGAYTGTLLIYNKTDTQFSIPFAPYTYAFTTFVAQYSSTGFVKWVAVVSSDSSQARSITTDSQGNITVVGTYKSFMKIYDKTGAEFKTPLTPTTNGSTNDNFIIQYNSAGFVNWASRITGTGDDTSYGCSTDKSGNINICGMNNSTPLLALPADILIYPST